MSLTCNSSSRWKVVVFCSYNQGCRSGVTTSIFLFDNVVCCVSLCIDAKAREAYSTGQNVYVPSPQVWLSFDRWCPLLGLSTSCSATFWQLFVFRATFFAFWAISSSFLPIRNICFSRQLTNFLWKKSVILSPPPHSARSQAQDAHSQAAKSAGFFCKRISNGRQLFTLLYVFDWLITNFHFSQNYWNW